MSFQKCPVCEGTGQVPRFGTNPVCHVCNGHGIIDEVTGQPPVSSVTISNSEDVYISKSLSDAPQVNNNLASQRPPKSKPMPHPSLFRYNRK